MHKQILSTFLKQKSLKTVTFPSNPLSKRKQFCCHILPDISLQTDKQNTRSAEGEYITIN